MGEVRRTGRLRSSRSERAAILRAGRAVLALSLLALGQGVAHAAGAPVFDPFATNPLAGKDVGLRAAPALADLDSDGDLDLIAGESLASFQYFENVGTRTAPIYVERPGAQNPANGLATLGENSQPALVDLDGDGKLELVGGSVSGTFEYFRNTGTRRAPAFAIAPTNPLAGFDVGTSSAPAFGDLDRDGDADLVAGSVDGGFAYYENVGTAEAPAFVERTGTANPLDGLTIDTALSSPGLGDADGDGDLDLISGTAQGEFQYFENAGSARRPAFRKLVQAANPLRGENVGSSFAKVAVGDLDGDGDLDLVGGADLGGFFAYESLIGQFVISSDTDPSSVWLPWENAIPLGDLDGDGDVEIGGQFCYTATNVGSVTAPAFAAATPLSTIGPCREVLVGVDIDADGDIDLVDGSRLLRNVGTPSSPTFVASPTPLFPGSPATPYDDFIAPFATFGDLDRDGDLDAGVIYRSPIEARFPLVTIYFENVGTSTVPLFSERSGAQNLLPLPSPQTAASLLDPDRDGDIDVLAGYEWAEDGSGPIAIYYENVGAGTPLFRTRGPTDPKHPFWRYLQLTRPLASLITGLADLDGDFDPDGFAVKLVPPYFDDFDGLFLESSIIRPSPRHVGPIASPFGARDVGSYSTLAAGDLDADGDPDFVASQSFADGAIHYFQNVGTALLPSVVERTGPENPFSGLSAGGTPMLALADLDGDGDLDLASGENGGNPLRYFENTGTTIAPAFVERSGGSNPLANAFAGRGAPSFGDLDGDGDFDLVMGRFEGSFQYFRNLGTPLVPVFAEQLGPANPFNGLSITAGGLSTAALGDVDRDGDLDLVAGDEGEGKFDYFENLGSAVAPSFIRRSGVESPLDGHDVGLNSTPALVDLDGDGDLDMISGNRDGTFEVYPLPEPSGLASLVAALGLLRRLSCGRGRVRNAKRD